MVAFNHNKLRCKNLKRSVRILEMKCGFVLERVMKYGLHWTDINRFKGRITEMLVKRYIEKVLIPALREQGWDQIIFTPNAWFGDEVEQNKNRPKHMQIFWNPEPKFFIENGLYPTEELVKSFKKLTKVLENVPDGFFFKLRKTEQTKRLKEALAEFGLQNGWGRYSELGEYSYSPSEHDDNEQLPIVEGEIEIVEIKTGKAIIPSHQMISYRKVLEERYALRFFHVNIISFEKNEFEIEEKLVTTPEELETVQKKEKEVRECRFRKT